MRTTTTTWAMLIALLTAVSCTETETGIEPEPGNGGDGQVALGISTNLKVDGTKAVTKSLVEGNKITYPIEQYSSVDYAPGLGILVTNSDANGWYTPDGTEYEGHHVWYMGDEKGANWISIKTKGDTYAKTTEVPYYLTKAVGKVYAYYPYNKDLTTTLSSITGETDLKIPVSVLTSGTIAATTNNAKKYWDGSKWATTKVTDLVNLALPTEKDYLYFVGTGGRYVNNGRADGQTPVTPDAEPNNTNTANPGYKINLDMKHGLAMVSIRVYDGGRLSDNNVNFTKFEIKNHDGGSNPFKTGSGKMSLVDGTITETSSTTSMTRTITDYILMRQVDNEENQSTNAFFWTGNTSSAVNCKTVSKTVSAIVYPIASFAENDIDVVITLKEGNNPAVEYPITLPTNTWEAANNYIYTFSAGRNKLTIMDVEVEPWYDNEQDEIPL